MLAYNQCILLFSFISYLKSEALNHSIPEAQLHLDIFRDYSSRIRPVLDPNKTLAVSVQLYLISIDTFNERERAMTSTIWLDVRWNDTFLSWDPFLYGDVKTIYVSLEKIWIPDILVRNEIGNKKGIRDGDFTDPIIHFTGNVAWWPGKDLKTKCEINTIKFPFDKQDCYLAFGKWYSPDSRIYLVNTSSTIDMTYYEINEEWEVEETYVKNVLFYEDENEFSRILFGIKVKRRASFVIMNLILPVILLSLLNQLSFLLPIESGEKIGMCMSIFLTFSVFLTLVGNFLPRSSVNTPAYCVYLVFQTALSILTITLEVLVLRIYHKESTLYGLTGKIAMCLSARYFTKEDLNDNMPATIWKQVAVKIDKICGCTMLALNVVFTTVFFVFIST